MERLLRNNYFVFVKVVGILALIVHSMLYYRGDLKSVVMYFLIGALFLFFSCAKELDNKSKRNYLWLSGEGITAVSALFLFPVTGIFYATIFILDLTSNLGTQFYFAIYFLLLVSYKADIDLPSTTIIMTLILVLYFQHYKIINWYEKTNKENIENESRLKSDIEHTNIAHRDELNKSRLIHENELLEEKGRLSQALHDKLGHSINGSLYKLEAAKAIMDSKPEQSKTILQEVIDNLRGSMDEIRVIIRNERPDKKRMALKSLQALCNECEEEYNIKATLEVEANDKEIPENIWEIILDNTFEAVTNALKYSGCTEINININVLGEVVRATIKDNGKGASHIEEGMGIQGMKTRVRNVKGYIDIESENGFSINMILPIVKKTEEINGTDQSNNRG